MLIFNFIYLIISNYLLLHKQKKVSFYLFIFVHDCDHIYTATPKLDAVAFNYVQFIMIFNENDIVIELMN